MVPHSLVLRLPLKVLGSGYKGCQFYKCGVMDHFANECPSHGTVMLY